MITMNINEAKTHFSSALEKVARGETVVLCKRNKPVAEIRPVREPLREKRPIGLAAREYPAFTIDQGFFEPLPDDIIKAFSDASE
ncbi:MAG: type II toxin-antitoxin system Phd/YefM family antitoxin [Desulfurivibrio sp.]|nr:MAG: type II toxin-antitoxin system Phd/YefM family antitoxin [Desulfurivibrio sp.]